MAGILYIKKAYTAHVAGYKKMFVAFSLKGFLIKITKITVEYWVEMRS